MNLCVVIPSARADNLVACVTALRAKDPELPPERIIVVDDGARAGAETRLPHVTWVTGETPFIFARNVNLGIHACPGDVILLNDDASLVTPGGFAGWSELMQAHPEIGVCSCGVRGAVGNPHQRAAAHGRLEYENDDLAFVCVYLPRRTLDAVGPLDERFTGYGFEDNDYCERVRYHGLRLAVWHGCVVNHDGHLPSSFRTNKAYPSLLAQNRRIFDQKYAAPTPAPAAPAPSATVQRRVDLMYIAHNRLEFTRESFACLLDHTDWEHVRELVVYDDGSRDGTREWLETNIRRIPAPHRLKRTSFGSPVAAMGDFIAASKAPILAKLDNDAVVPPGWLGESLGVLDRHPELGLLGIEAMYPCEPGGIPNRGYVPAQFIGGLGVFRRQAFARGLPTARRKYFGFGEWQVAQGKQLVRGWIKPAVPVFLLDRIPFAPWADYSAEYVRRGWQRTWAAYPPDCTLWQWRWPKSRTTSAAPAVLSPSTTPVATDDATAQAGLPAESPGLRLNLRWLAPAEPGFTEVEIAVPEDPSFVDLRQPWPWTSDSVSTIHAADVLQHFTEKIHLLNELWRVLRPGGTVQIVLPTTDGPGAFMDPTQVSFWNRRSFLYFEDGNPYRERHARRYGITARFRVVRESTATTADGPRLDITMEAAKGAEPAPTVIQVAAIAAPAAASTPGFVAALRVKNEAEHIGEAIASVLPLCEHVFVFDDHSTDTTVAIARSFGDRCTVVPSIFDGLDEARDKNALLTHLVRANPAWVLWIDGDEVLESGAPAVLRRAATVAGIAAYSLRVAYLWDTPLQVRVDGVYGRFARPSFFRLRGQNAAELKFVSSGNGGNLHCGNIPRGLKGSIRPLPVRLKHYGYLSSEQRDEKYRWYTAVDPHNQGEDHYRHIAGIKGARHAPGPPILVPWRE